MPIRGGAPLPPRLSRQPVQRSVLIPLQSLSAGGLGVPMLSAESLAGRIAQRPCGRRAPAPKPLREMPIRGGALLRRRRFRRAALRLWTAVALPLSLLACSGDPGTGPVEVKWDRDVCQRCNMVLSDRRHSAQIRRLPSEGSRSQVYKFDDIGCAVLWLDQQSWRNGPGVELWVSDHRNGDWLDARRARYVAGQLTPMQYGLGAQPDPAPGTLSFSEAREHIYRVEQQHNIHGGNLEHAEPSTPTPSPGAQ